MSLAQYADNGIFAPRKFADAFRTTSEEVARTAGLGKDAVHGFDLSGYQLQQGRTS